MWTFLLQTRGEREEEEEKEEKKEEEKEEGRGGGEGKRKRERGRGKEEEGEKKEVNTCQYMYKQSKFCMNDHIIFPLTFTLESLSDKTQHVTGTEVALSGRGIRVNREGVTMNCPFTF